jgi:phosphoribosylglycinamide formyltransferase 2
MCSAIRYVYYDAHSLTNSFSKRYNVFGGGGKVKVSVVKQNKYGQYSNLTPFALEIIMAKNSLRIGTPYTDTATKVMLLGSGELGKEVAIELNRLGVEVIAVDRYENAPAMQIAQRSYVIDMLDGSALRKIVEKEKPHRIVPEIEAIATDELVKLESEGFQVIPTARAAKLTMDREGIRRLAAEELGLETARYAFADSFEEFTNAAEDIGFPCVIKPIMSSSGKGQSVCKSAEDLKECWEISQSGGRAGNGRIIIEEFIKFESEITLLTVRSVSGTHFCDAIGHRQKGGDYVESWQPHKMSDQQITDAQNMAKKITTNLGGWGLFGVELFLLKDGRVLFSEVSPRPHDTGLVTISTQTHSEFALHARALLGLPILDIFRHSAGASAAVKASSKISTPVFDGLSEALAIDAAADFRIFGKPNATVGRRMAVALARDPNSAEKALSVAMASREKFSCLQDN